MGGVRLLLVPVIAAVVCIAEGRPQADDLRSEVLLVKSFGQSDRRQSREGAQQSHSQHVRPFGQVDSAREDASRDNPQGLVRSFGQSGQREGAPESLPVRNFNQYDTRGSPSQRVAPQPVIPFAQTESGAGDSAQKYAQREHPRREEDPYQSRAHSSPHNTPRITLQSAAQPTDGRKKDETPNWSTSHVRLEPKHTLSGMGDGRGHSVGQQSSSTPLQRDNRRTATAPEQKGKGGGSRGQQGGASRDLPVRMGAAAEVAGGEEQGKSGPATEGGIVFPGPTRDGKVPPGKFVPQIGTVAPDCAEGSTFCVSADSYPSEYLKAVLRNEAEGLKEFFGNDLLLNETSLVQRIDSSDENPLCQSVEQVVYPKMAQNKEDKWLYVVNQDQYIQGVRVEKCLKPESECLLTKSFPLGYKTTCRQKYIYRRMLALNDDGKALSDTFRLPSCCSCFVKSTAGSDRKR